MTKQLLIQNVQTTANKLTVTKDEIRLKVNGEDDLRLISFTQRILKQIEEQEIAITKTARGAFYLKNDEWMLTLREMPDIKFMELCHE